MLADPKRANSRESSQIGLPDTIFAGLSFPVVPTSDITVKKHRYSQLNTGQLTADEEDFEEEVKFSPNESLLGNKELSNPTIVSPASQRYTSTISSQDIKRHLSRLYTSHDTLAPRTDVSANLYPELPDIKSMDISTHESSSLLGNRVPNHTNQVNVPYVVGNHVGVAPTAPPAIQMVSMSSRGNDTELIDDLIAQNSQLADEVATLKARLATQLNSSTNSSDVGMDARHPAIGVAMSGEPGTTTQSDPSLDQIKYISCGHCKLWFFSPKNAIYVTCPTCESINNCGPPKNRPASESNTAVASPNPFVWIFPCLKGVL